MIQCPFGLYILKNESNMSQVCRLYLPVMSPSEGFSGEVELQLILEDPTEIIQKIQTHAL